MPHEHATPGQVIDLNTFRESKTTALVKEKQFEVIRLSVEPGRPVHPHKVNGPVTVQCLSGKCTFFVGDERRKLEPGCWLYMEGGTMHSVESHEPATLLITILFGKA